MLKLSLIVLLCFFFVNVLEMNIVVGGFYLKKEIFFER